MPSGSAGRPKKRRCPTPFPRDFPTEAREALVPRTSSASSSNYSTHSQSDDLAVLKQRKCLMPKSENTIDEVRQHVRRVKSHVSQELAAQLDLIDGMLGNLEQSLPIVVGHVWDDQRQRMQEALIPEMNRIAYPLICALYRMMHGKDPASLQPPDRAPPDSFLEDGQCEINKARAHIAQLRTQIEGYAALQLDSIDKELLRLEGSLPEEDRKSFKVQYQLVSGSFEKVIKASKGKVLIVCQPAVSDFCSMIRPKKWGGR
ncbi:hypothetical protein LTR37_021395 [Vermiconidia calcicola]|uniref:Uncharacterized protein n=1 Tax=Vermiconidia calcicola TaxID=1690605 RepID=A0ACC3MAH0_9PEZI|nr:hypothetical protein LTR37_021395 [Vermiconidia calcicola]